MMMITSEELRLVSNSLYKPFERTRDKTGGSCVLAKSDGMFCFEGIYY
jgi:hypothetical protein